MFDQKMKEVQQVIEQNTHQKKLYIQSIKKYLIELEEKNRKELRQWCNEQQVRLGRWHLSGPISSSSRVNKEMWHEGEAYRKITTRIQQIQVEKEEIEKLKKNRKRDTKMQNKTKTNLPLVPDAFGLLNE